MSKKSSTFVPDMGIVPIKIYQNLRVMRKECVFRAELEGSLWRVERDACASLDELKTYRIIHNRRCYARITDTDARIAIKACLQFVLGYRVTIDWGTEL